MGRWGFCILEYSMAWRVKALVMSENTFVEYMRIVVLAPHHDGAKISA